MPFDSAACCFDCGCLLTNCLRELDVPADAFLVVRLAFFAGALFLLAVFLLDFFLLDLVLIVSLFLLANNIHNLPV
jgi:hypothetical protein